MLESGYYPPGAEFDPHAPYNEVEIPERKFDATISSSLSKSTTIESKDYIIEEDPDGSYIDTSEIRWLEEYKEAHLTPLELIEKFKETLEKKLKVLEQYNGCPNNANFNFRSEINKTKYLIEECKGWVEDECEVIGD